MCPPKPWSPSLISLLFDRDESTRSITYIFWVLVYSLLFRNSSLLTVSFSYSLLSFWFDSDQASMEQLNWSRLPETRKLFFSFDLLFLIIGSPKLVSSGLYLGSLFWYFDLIIGLSIFDIALTLYLFYWIKFLLRKF